MTTPRRSRRAIPYGDLMKKRMAERGYTQTRLAAQLGVNQRTVSFWCRGVSLPTIERAGEIADVLLDARLLKMAVEMKTGTCPCGRPFSKGLTRRAYCSTACQRNAHLKNGKKADPKQDAIDLMCRTCEPEGVCRDARCPLRSFSPMPFSTGFVVPDYVLDKADENAKRRMAYTRKAA